MLSENEIKILNTPIKDLSPEERFVAFSISDKIAKHNRSQPCGDTVKNISVLMRDKLLENGVISPLDGKTVFLNRYDWSEHLKRNGCVEIGNDFNNAVNKKRETEGDFNCRAELAKVTHQVAEKYGY